MATLYQSTHHWNQYLIRSARARWWDYGKNGVYYVTICTKNRFPFLGSIQAGQLKLSVLGATVKQLWESLPSLVSGIHLSSFVIMPNHIHGIIILDRPAGQEPLKSTIVHNSTAPLHPQSKDKAVQSAFFKSISPQKGSLPHIIRKFKGLVTKTARKAGWIKKDQPLWQARYYDRVIRDPNEFFKLSQHIKDNVKTWKQDDYFFPIPSTSTDFELLPPAKPLLKNNSKPSQQSPTIPFKNWQLSFCTDVPSILTEYWRHRAGGYEESMSWSFWLMEWLKNRTNDS